MLLWYFFISFAIGFCACFLSVTNIIYTMLVMLRRGPSFAVVNVMGICLAQAIWAATTAAVLLLFGDLYDPAIFDYWWDGLLAGAVLLYLAYRILVANPKNNFEDQEDQSGRIQSKKQGLKQFSVGFILTITSPQWPVIYLLALSSLQVVIKHGQWGAMSAVGLGLLLGVILFWFLDFLILKLLRAKATLKAVHYLSRSGGIAMLFFATVALVDSFWLFFK